MVRRGATGGTGEPKESKACPEVNASFLARMLPVGDMLKAACLSPSKNSATRRMVNALQACERPDEARLWRDLMTENSDGVASLYVQRQKLRNDARVARAVLSWKDLPFLTNLDFRRDVVLVTLHEVDGHLRAVHCRKTSNALVGANDLRVFGVTKHHRGPLG
jgi:hypothetical protein